MAHIIYNVVVEMGKGEKGFLNIGNNNFLQLRLYLNTLKSLKTTLRF